MAMPVAAVRSTLIDLPARVRALGPGFLVAALIAITAQSLADHYGVPAMLMALLLGIAFHFLAEEGRSVPGAGPRPGSGSASPGAARPGNPAGPGQP